MGALELSWSMGCIPELDVRTTKDGHVMMFHDKDFSRIMPGASDAMKRKRLEDLTYEEAKQLDIGAFRGPEFAGLRGETVLASRKARYGERAVVAGDDRPVVRTRPRRTSSHPKRCPGSNPARNYGFAMTRTATARLCSVSSLESVFPAAVTPAAPRTSSWRHMIRPKPGRRPLKQKAGRPPASGPAKTIQTRVPLS